MKKIIGPALILFLICFTVSLALGVTNRLTEAPIEEQRQKALDLARQSVLPEAVSFEKLQAEGMDGYIGFDADGGEVGYVFTETAKGYGGDVTAVIGLNTDGIVTGVSLSAPDETPGLGANVATSSFESRFTGRSYAEPLVMKENISAVTGATYSSKAAALAVNRAFDDFKTVTGK
ncbi:MAG: FMN-binding protein [Clostridia bacterium]|nr:FMN-binding protein [Clostridia bacterium]